MLKKTITRLSSRLKREVLLQSEAPNIDIFLKTDSLNRAEQLKAEIDYEKLKKFGFEKPAQILEFMGKTIVDGMNDFGWEWGSFRNGEVRHVIEELLRAPKLSQAEVEEFALKFLRKLKTEHCYSRSAGADEGIDSLDSFFDILLSRWKGESTKFKQEKSIALFSRDPQAYFTHHSKSSLKDELAHFSEIMPDRVPPQILETFFKPIADEALLIKLISVFYKVHATESPTVVPLKHPLEMLVDISGLTLKTVSDTSIYNHLHATITLMVEIQRTLDGPLFQNCTFDSKFLNDSEQFLSFLSRIRLLISIQKGATSVLYSSAKLRSELVLGRNHFGAEEYIAFKIGTERLVKKTYELAFRGLRR